MKNNLKRYFHLIVLLAILFIIPLIRAEVPPNDKAAGSSEAQKISLPEPDVSGGLTVEQAIKQRRSLRAYAGSALTLKEISSLLYSAQGITDAKRGLRSVPSAGATYPLEVYLVAGKVDNLPAGVYRYLPRTHTLEAVRQGDIRPELMKACYGQNSVGSAPASIVLAAVFSRTSGKYGERSKRYVHFEVGHAGENISLQCEALGMGCVMVGAFSDAEIKSSVGLTKAEEPMYVIPMGKKP
jgi:SagB-type dehydrogenase family enzyme